MSKTLTAGTFRVGALRNTPAASNWQTWIDTYVNLLKWDLQLDTLHNVDELKAIHAIEKHEANAAFANYIQEHYSKWLVNEDSPTLSVDVVHRYVIPEVQAGKQVMFVVMDCMRLDHWLENRADVPRNVRHNHTLLFFHSADGYRAMPEMPFLADYSRSNSLNGTHICTQNRITYTRALTVTRKNFCAYNLSDTVSHSNHHLTISKSLIHKVKHNIYSG